jgi:hypothetical protein
MLVSSVATFASLCGELVRAERECFEPLTSARFCEPDGIIRQGRSEKASRWLYAGIVRQR